MRVLLEVGAGNVMDFVSRFGFDTRTFPRNTQLAIGGGTMAVTPIDMATAYAVLANGGYEIEPHVIAHVRDLNGDVVYRGRHPVVCETCEDELDVAGAEPAAADDDLLDGEPANFEELFGAAPDPGVAADPLAAAMGSNPAGEVVLPDIPATRVIDERNAYIMNSMLKDVIRRGTGRRARSLQRTDLAGKTGTTNDAADTWFNGYNADLVATVWVGFPNHQPLGANAYGSNTPLPIWIEYMQAALAGVPESSLEQPAGVVTMKIDPTSGTVAAARMGDAIFEFFLAEHAPQQPTTDRPGDKDTDDDIRAVDIF